jgi:hypothetical protein
VGLAVSLWIGFGGPKPPPKLLPMSTDSCTHGGNITTAEIRIGKDRWEHCKTHHICCWPIRCRSVFAGWINYTEIHFKCIFSYDTSSIKDGVCCIMRFYFKGCNPHWASFVLVFFLTLDCKLVTSLRWYWKQAIEIIIPLVTVCSNCSLLYVTSILPNILWIKQHTHALGMFSKLWEVAISFVMCVDPSVRMEQLDSHWMNWMKVDIWGFLNNIFRKLSVIKFWQE